MYRSPAIDVYLGHRLSKYSPMYTQSTDRRGQIVSTDSDCAGGKQTDPGTLTSQAPAMRPKLFDKESDWKPSRTNHNTNTGINGTSKLVNGNTSNNNNNNHTNKNPLYGSDSDNADWPADFDPADQPHLRDAINQDLVDLLRSQIACLLEENEKILLALDDYRERITVLNRERKESTPDPSAELMALQTELSDARLREAELTVAFGELQHRIAEIDRMIESDPEMEAFFNAVTISPTTLSRQKPLHRTPSSRNESPGTRHTRNVRSARDHDSHFSPGRKSQIYANDYRSPKHATAQSPPRNRRSTLKSCTARSGDQYGHGGEMESDQSNATAVYSRSGLESPQSDSGCSLNSHTTSEGRDHAGDHSFDDSETRKSSLVYGRNVGPGGVGSVEPNEPDEPDQDDEELKNKHGGRPRGFVSMIRRSRSTAADHSFMSGFHSEIHSPVCANGFDDPPQATAAYTPTPTESHPTMANDSATANESKTVDKFSRFRASFRQSLGFGPAKPDFRSEAFAARQGEARALLSLRETRMELLRVQSRCQTLQRHMERLEAINNSRMEELEAAVGCERDLRQEIRNLQRRIFELEAEHREFKVNQRIKEMELVSKLAEANLRLSHAELNSQQAVIWSELSQAHDAASNLFTPSQSNLSVYVPTSSSSTNGSRSRDPSAHPTGSNDGDRSRVEQTRKSMTGPARARPTLEHSMTRLDAVKRRMDRDTLDDTMDRNTSCNDLSSGHRVNSDKPGAEQQQHQSVVIERSVSQRAMDQSLGSLSDLRLQPDSSLLMGHSSTYRP